MTNIESVVENGGAAADSVVVKLQSGEPAVPSLSAPPPRRADWKRIALAIGIVGVCWGAALFLAFPNPLELIRSNWIITPIAFVAAAFANATAIGGGFLFVPLFVFVYHLNPVAALKLSLATQAFGMTSGALGWSRRFIVVEALPAAFAASALGMYFGTYHLPISAGLVKTSFAWVSLFIFFVVILEIRCGTACHEVSIRTADRWRLFFFFAACFAGGLVTAWTAIGIGEVVALYLLFVYRVRVESAIGTGVAVLAFDSLAGLLFHTHLGGILWEYLVFTAPGVVLGGFFGATMGRHIEDRGKRRRQHRTVEVERPNSPLKWLFASVILLDSMVMFAQSYAF